MDINFWNERWDKEEIAFHMNEVNPMLIKHFPKLSLEEQKRISVVFRKLHGLLETHNSLIIKY